MKKTGSILLCLTAFLFSACAAPVKEETVPHATREFFAMDTYMTVTAYGEECEDAVKQAEKEVHRLDRLLSAEDPDSEVYRINQTKSARLSEDSAFLTEKAAWIYNQTDGAYDITVYPLMTLWGFNGDHPSVPAEDTLQNTLLSVGFDKLTFQNNRLTLGKDQGIDFGGIAKGYASTRIMQIFDRCHIHSGVVSLGGNVQCKGTKTDGSLWRCGITDPDYPEDNSRLAGVLQVSDKAVITSGGYERYFTENGTTYHHIMHPGTGYPAESGLCSVTIVSEDGTLADGLSTACFVMGKEKAVAFWKQHKELFDMVLIEDDRSMFITEGLRESFTSDREYAVIENNK